MIADIEERYVQAFDKASASTVSVLAADSQMGPCCGRFRRGRFGTGVVLNREGHILTNQHVVHEADRVMIVLNNGHVFTGKMVGGDKRTDIAVVKVEGEQLTPAELGDSEKLRVGQPILALGNSLGLSGGPTVTSGVISSLRRNMLMGQGNGMAVLQTDASVNPGSSGGPLVNLSGEVVAITTAQIPYAEGMGFAIPINIAKSIAGQLIEHGKVQRAWLGVTAYDVSPRLAYQFRLPDTDGVFVAEVVHGSPADAADLRMGDVLLNIDDKQLANVTDLLTALNERKIGQEIEAKVRRNGRMEQMHVTLGTRPC
ncbi:MAG: trypsin-like peptidase domain-containing protein [Methanomassiliicoccales archaeon]|jgi:serine protease Do